MVGTKLSRLAEQVKGEKYLPSRNSELWRTENKQPDGSLSRVVGSAATGQSCARRAAVREGARAAGAGGPRTCEAFPLSLDICSVNAGYRRHYRKSLPAAGWCDAEIGSWRQTSSIRTGSSSGKEELTVFRFCFLQRSGKRWPDRGEAEQNETRSTEGDKSEGYEGFL